VHIAGFTAPRDSRACDPRRRADLTDYNLSENRDRLADAASPDNLLQRLHVEEGESKPHLVSCEPCGPDLAVRTLEFA
jgi:hypothetical protein